MCGLVAVVGNLTATDKKVFAQLLYVDALRGEDSTGIFNEKHDSFKLAVMPDVFLQMRQTDRVINSASKVLVGHNRAATRGGVSSQNAHPFEHGDIIGVHNGTLRTWHNLEDSTKFTVDSDCLYHTMNQIGDVQTIEKLNGAYALMYMQSGNPELNVIRNSERPLWYCHSKALDKIYIASEYQMLALVLSRNKVEMHHNEKGYAFFQFPQNKLHRIDPAAPHGDAIDVLDVKEYTPVSYTGGTGYSNYGGYAVDVASENRLKELGVASGQRIVVHKIEFSKYANGAYGYLECVMETSPYATVRVNGLSATEAGRLGDRFTVRVDTSPQWLNNKAVQGDLTSYCVLCDYPQNIGQVIEIKKQTPLHQGLLPLTKTGLKGKAVNECLKHGCFWCSDPLYRKQQASAMYFRDENGSFKPICKRCQREDVIEINQFITDLQAGKVGTTMYPTYC